MARGWIRRTKAVNCSFFFLGKEVSLGGGVENKKITPSGAVTIKRESWKTKLEKVLRKNHLCKAKEDVWILDKVA